MPEPEQPQPQPDPKRHPDLELQLPLLREEWRARELLELEPQEPLQELQPARVPRQPVQLDRDDLPVEVQLYVRWLTWVMLFLAHQWLLRLPHMGQMVEPTKGLMRLGLLMDRGKKALPLKHLLPMRLFLQLLD